jgi:hypothetical protein
MTTTLFTDISAALNSRLATLASPPPIDWPNTDYIPIEGITFIRPRLLPSSGALFTIAGSYLNAGIYQISIFCPINTGTQNCTNLLNQLQQLYSVNKTLVSNNTTVYIQDIIEGKSQRENAWYSGYIEIHYICYS